MVFSQSKGKWQKKGEVGREMSKIANTRSVACVSQAALPPGALLNPGTSRPVSSGGERRTFPTAWRQQVPSQASVGVGQEIPKAPERDSPSPPVTSSMGKDGEWFYAISGGCTARLGIPHKTALGGSRGS